MQRCSSQNNLSFITRDLVSQKYKTFWLLFGFQTQTPQLAALQQIAPLGKQLLTKWVIFGEKTLTFCQILFPTIVASHTCGSHTTSNGGAAGTMDRSTLRTPAAPRYCSSARKVAVVVVCGQYQRDLEHGAGWAEGTSGADLGGGRSAHQNPLPIFPA